MFHRRSIRLPGYDYATNGSYFVTICTHNRASLFGEISQDKMVLNQFGKHVDTIWHSLPMHHHIKLDTFQIMPNHIHGIIVMPFVGATRGSPCEHRGSPSNMPRGTSHQQGGSRPAPTLGIIIGLFKSECTKQIRHHCNDPLFQLWQRNYYEHIIRNEQEYNHISRYIISNPANWDHDKLND